METRDEIALPRPFLEKMERLLGQEFSDFIKSYDEERLFGLRLNPLKEEGELPEMLQNLKKIPWTAGAFYYDGSLRPGKHPYHEAGLYYIQEPSAMAVTEALKPMPGETILDLCAAPGGKTTHIAGNMDGRGLLVSNEIHPARARILSQNVERMGIKNTVVTNEEPARLVPFFHDFFDGIVVDAPCSGEGMFRKDQNARQEWSPDHVKLCAGRQDKILDCAAKMLKAGGRLVYSTCTFSPEENEGTVSRFLDRHPEFTVMRPDCARWFSCGRPEWDGGKEELRETVRIWPHKTEGEGHFLALLVKDGGSELEEGNAWQCGGIGQGWLTEQVCRTEQGRSADRGRPTDQGRLADRGQPTDQGRLTDRGQPADQGRPTEKGRRIDQGRPTDQGRRTDLGRRNRKDHKNDSFSLGDYKKFCEETLRDMKVGADVLDAGAETGGRLLAFGENLYRIPGEMPPFEGLRVLRPGLHLGTLKKGRFEPSHALALSLKIKDVILSADVGRGETAGRYLRGEAIPIIDTKYGTNETAADSKGWTLITAGGYSLGWAKAAGGILKNHYPKGLRQP